MVREEIADINIYDVAGPLNDFIRQLKVIEAQNFSNIVISPYEISNGFEGFRFYGERLENDKEYENRIQNRKKQIEREKQAKIDELQKTEAKIQELEKAANRLRKQTQDKKSVSLAKSRLQSVTD